MSHSEQPPARLLVVDDEELIRRFVTRVLADAGCEVVAAADANAALEVVDSQPAFQLFVLDLRMPEMPGDELARRIRLRNPDAKILFLTGCADPLFADRSVLCEREAFLEKPVTARALLEGVSLLLLGRTETLRPPALHA